MAAELAKETGITQDRNTVAERADFDDHRAEDYDFIISRCLVYCKPSAAQRLSDCAISRTSWLYAWGFWGGDLWTRAP